LGRKILTLPNKALLKEVRYSKDLSWTNIPLVCPVGENFGQFGKDSRGSQLSKLDTLMLENESGVNWFKILL